jgi:hypothetical protein
LYESSIKREVIKRFGNRCSATVFVHSTPAIQDKLLLSLPCDDDMELKNWLVAIMMFLLKVYKITRELHFRGKIFVNFKALSM